MVLRTSTAVFLLSLFDQSRYSVLTVVGGKSIRIVIPSSLYSVRGKCFVTTAVGVSFMLVGFCVSPERLSDKRHSSKA